MNQQDEYGCAVSYLPLLTIENSQQTRQAGAAIESFRNEMVKSNEKTYNTLIDQKNFKDFTRKVKHS